MIKRHYSLRFKLVAMCMSLLLAVCTLLSAVTYFIVGKSFEKEAVRSTQSVMNGVSGLVSQQEQEIHRCARLIASRPDMVQAIASSDSAAVRRIALELTVQEKLDVLTISDAKGKVLARGHSATAGDSVLSQANVRLALEGKTGLGYEAGTAVRLALRCGFPVIVEGKVVGCVTTGVNLSSKEDFVDMIKKYFDFDCSVFSGEERVSTTLASEGKRLKGSKMDNAQVIGKVLQSGQAYMSLESLQGVRSQLAYWPIKAPDGKIVGMIGITQPLDAMRKTLEAILMGIIVVALGGLVIAAGVALWVAKSVSSGIEKHADTIRKGSENVLTTATQVSEASQKLAEGVSSEAAALEETSASIEELSSMTKRNFEHTEKAAALVREARQVADAGGTDSQAMSDAMQAIKRSSDDVAKIIKSIDEIAFQTNILALNASVEAARAGEAGAGFAVVAEEVRNLAHRSAEAAKQTATQIDSAIGETGRGVELSHKVIGCLNGLAERVRSLDALIGEVATASKEQSQGLGQLNMAVTAIDKVTQASAANSEETAAAAKELSGSADLLYATVGELELIVRGC